jgi:glycosyltransferase involved in cell wall biosynthesis
MKEKIDLVIIQKIFAYYRKPLFDKLSKKYKMLLLHSKNKSGIKQVEANYSKKIFGINFNRKNDTNVFLATIIPLLKYRPKIVIHEFALGIISLPLVILICKILKIKLILWSHGYDRKKGFNPEGSFQDRLRLFYFRIADAILLYSENDKFVLARYIDKKKIFVAQNTFDTDSLLKIKGSFVKKGKEKIKKELKIKHKYNLIYIGRLLKSKSPELLIEIYENLSNKFKKNTAIHFIGDGEMLPKLRATVKDKKYINNFYFHGAIFNEEINGKYLFASDLMVMPGALGLSIVHSFCFGCPVVSFKQTESGPYHGPEIDYIVNNKTGYLAKNKDLSDIVKFIERYFTDTKLRKNILNNIESLVKNKLTLNNMINGIINGIDYCQKK